MKIKNLLLLLFLFTVFPYPCSTVNAKTRRALLVGINNYTPKIPPPCECRQEWSNLKGCLNDVEALKSILISSSLGFKENNIQTLKNETATRGQIISNFKKHLIADACPGDTCLFYFSGHGSRIKNSRSDEPDKMDETLVPADWFRGVPDIRDKELKKLYNQVLDKGVHLTVIIDACHSGSSSRGIPVPVRNRCLPSDPRDFSEPSYYDGSPAAKGALIFSAARNFQAAVETRDENGHWHGLFTWALLKTLQAAGDTMSARDILLKTKAFMQSERPFQEPNLEGLPKLVRKTIIGTPVNALNHTLKVPTSFTRRSLVELLGGYAVGIRKNCEFRKIIGTKADKTSPVRLQVTAVDGLNRSTAKIIRGSTGNVKKGDFFELDKWVAPKEAPMRIHVPKSRYSHKRLFQIAREISKIRKSKRICWVEDPSMTQNSEKSDGSMYIITFQQSEWVLIPPQKKYAQLVKLGPTPRKKSILKHILKHHSDMRIKPRVFLRLPLSTEISRTIHMEFHDYRHSIAIVSSETESHYLLVGRMTREGIQYAWVVPNMIENVERDFLLPVRTAWINTGENISQYRQVAEKLCDKMLQLARIRAWQQLDSPPGNNRFPYQLTLKNTETGEVTTSGPLMEGENYRPVLKMDKNLPRLPGNIEKRYVYVFVIDSYGKGSLLFPQGLNGNMENCFPIAPDGKPETEIKPGNEISFEIAEPFGMDTFIMLTTTEAILNPRVLDFNGVRREEVDASAPLAGLLYDLHSLSRKKKSRPVPPNWSLQRLTIRSIPKK